MPDLVYPQLRTGAIVHYPIRKTAVTRTVSNVLPGGTVLMYPDDPAHRTNWSWEYVGLTLDEAAALQDFFNACNGPLRPFTFLDPTGNLLSGSSNFGAPAWQLSSKTKISADFRGPFLDSAALSLVNEGQALQELCQTLTVPCDYTYCFSVYVSSPTREPVILFRRGIHSEESVSLHAGLDWSRVWTAGNLQDPSTGLCVGVKLLPGQQLSVSAAQLQVQPSLSPYRNRPQAGDIYSNAHWAIDELNVRHVGPNNCSMSVSIEA